MQSLVAELCSRHHPGVLLVTHDVEEAILLADRVLVLTDSRISLDHAVELPGHGESVGRPLTSSRSAPRRARRPGRAALTPRRALAGDAEGERIDRARAGLAQRPRGEGQLPAAVRDVIDEEHRAAGEFTHQGVDEALLEAECAPELGQALRRIGYGRPDEAGRG